MTGLPTGLKCVYLKRFMEVKKVDQNDRVTLDGIFYQVSHHAIELSNKTQGAKIELLQGD